jgi:hypothetical protein
LAEELSMRSKRGLVGAVGIAVAQQALSEILGKVAAAMSATVDGLNGLPPAPEPAGDQATQRLLEIYTLVRQQVVDAKAELDAAGPDDAQVLFDTSATMASIATSLSQLEDPMAGVGDSPELAAAAEKASNCQTLTSVGM